MVFWIAVAAIVYLVGDSALRGAWAAVGFMLPLGLFIVWLLWMILLRPHVRYNATRALVVNIGRVHEIPWARVEAVRQRLGIVFELDNGSRVTAAGASAPRGMGTIIGGITGTVGNEAANFNKNAEPLDAMRAGAHPTDSPAIARWDTVPLAVGAGLLLVAIVDVVISLAR